MLAEKAQQTTTPRETIINTISIFIQTSGGLGLFLLGMIVMTDGLHALAGNTIRNALMRFTKTPYSGAITGAFSTAILQSSSATIVTAVGFVSAELLSFSAALGIIFGANVGTTVTGWVVALLGFKLQLSTFVLPFIFIGAVLRLFTSGRLAHWGMVIAGFGLIFVGISMMQQGMGALQDVISFDNMPADSLGGRLLLVASGILFTAITQSSSAGVAATLTALFSGLIDFEQAAALVIGMDIGTTVTAAIATIGRPVEAKRTGFSHVFYNLFSATNALILLTPFIWFIESVAPGMLQSNPEFTLVVFHSFFNIFSVILIIPFTHKFAGIVQTIIPDKPDQFTNKLDTRLLKQPSLALNAVQVSIKNELLSLLYCLKKLLDKKETTPTINLRNMQLALDKTHDFIDNIHLQSGDGSDWQRLVALIHTLDHMQRLHERLEEEAYRAEAAHNTPELKENLLRLIHTIDVVIRCIDTMEWYKAKQLSSETAIHFEDNAKVLREAVMKNIGTGKISVREGTTQVEAIRWMRRVSKHIARICDRLNDAVTSAGA